MASALEGHAGNPYVVGNSVGGTEAFVGREDVMREVDEALAEPRSQGLLLYGQRRIGKTSILHHLEVTLPGRTGKVPVYFDLQPQAGKPLGDVLGDLARGIAAKRDLPPPSSGPDVRTWFRDEWLPGVLAGLPAGASIVLLVDELDVLTDPQAQQAAADLLRYLRALLERSAPRLQAVFVIGRNVDDNERVAQAFFKGMLCHKVTLLSRQDAEALIRLSETNGTRTWDAEAVAETWRLTHGHPLFLQELCSKAWHRSGAAIPIGVDDVRSSVDEAMNAVRNMFGWIWTGLTPEARVFASALATAGPEAITRDEVQRRLRDNGVMVLLREMQDAIEALREWDLLEEIRPKHYRFRVEILRRLIERNRPLEKVREDIDRNHPAAEASYAAAVVDWQDDKHDEAIAHLEDALRRYPAHLRAAELLADVLISRKEWEKARDVLDRLSQNHPAGARDRLLQVLPETPEGPSDPVDRALQAWLAARREAKSIRLKLAATDAMYGSVIADEVHQNEIRGAGITRVFAYAAGWIGAVVYGLDQYFKPYQEGHQAFNLEVLAVILLLAAFGLWVVSFVAVVLSTFQVARRYWGLAAATACTALLFAPGADLTMLYALHREIARRARLPAPPSPPTLGAPS